MHSGSASFLIGLFEYYALLRLRYKVPVFPLVVYLTAGTGGLREPVYEETLFGQTMLTFRFQEVGLPDLSADDYQEVDNPLGPALSALMQPSALGRTLQKALSLRRLLSSQLDEARKALFINLVETYMTLSTREENDFRRILRQEELQGVTEMLTVYEERGIIKGKREALLMQLRIKFGDLPEAVVARVQTIDTEAALDALLERVLRATTLGDMGLE
jgi:hypothetical protein